MSVVERPDGCRLLVEERGPTTGPPLALLEGMGGSLPGWRRNLPQLAARCRVIAHDARGNGRSTVPDAPVSMTTFVEDLVAVLDAVGVGEAHLYGQSFGGMVAIELALTHPDRVRSLILACTHAGAGRASRVEPPVRVRKDAPHLVLYAERFAAEHPEHVAEDVRAWAGHRQRPHARRRQWEAMQAFDAWDRLGEIHRPTLVLHGTEDRVVAVENARRLAGAIAGAELVLLEGAGHVLHSERPEEVDASVLAFVQRVEGAA